MSTTVRISDATWTVLGRIAELEGEPMQTILERAVEFYRSRRFLESVNAAYGELKRSPGGWKALEEERRAWEGTSADGLLVRDGSGKKRW